MGNSPSTPTPTPPASQPVLGMSGRKICCSCPDTKALRDDCVVRNGEEECADVIEKHKICLRKEGFTIK